MRGFCNNPVRCIDCGEKKAGPTDRLCPPCRGKRNGLALRKHDWTPEIDERLRAIYAQHGHDRKEVGRLLKQLTQSSGIPNNALRTRASNNGWTCWRYRSWRKEEIAFLMEHAGSKTISRIARELKRKPGSVKAVAQRLRLSLRVEEGYAQTELARLLHVQWQRVQRWISRGWLRVDAETGRITEESVRRFIFSYPEEYSLKMVEEFWFKGIVFPHFGRKVRESLGRKQPSRNPFNPEERIA
jgi:hypothetical protein